MCCLCLTKHDARVLGREADKQMGFYNKNVSKYKTVHADKVVTGLLCVWESHGEVCCLAAYT